MKTLGEVQVERAAEDEKFRKDHYERCAKLYEASAAIPPYKAVTEHDRTNYVESQAIVRRLLKEGSVELYMVACDNCKTQLVNTDPHIVFTSNPPKKRITCPGCGWTGFTSTTTL